MNWDPTVNLGSLAELGVLLLSLWGLYVGWSRRMRKIEMKINIMFMYFRKGLDQSDRDAIDKFFEDNP